MYHGNKRFLQGFNEMKIFSALYFSAVISGLLLFTASCSKPQMSSEKKITVGAGLPPVASLVASIGGDKVETVSLLPAGRTPHDFSPKPSDINTISKARVFFSSGMPFEEKSLVFLSKKMLISDISAEIKKIPQTGHSHKEQCSGNHCHSENMDPHIWVSPANLLIIAENICTNLIKIDPANALYYRKNTGLLKEKITTLDRYIRTRLAPYAGRTFFIYHPSLGYFAGEYALNQRAVELDGREVSAVQLAQLINLAKKQSNVVLFVQEEFNPRTAKAIAGQLNATIKTMNPLQMDVLHFLRQITDDLADGFSGKKE